MPDPYRKLTAAAVDIATQLRRLADAHTTGRALDDSGEQSAPVDWQAIVARRERELKTEGERRHHAEAALASRSRELAELRAELEQARQDVAFSDEAARRASQLRQDMATERYALQERAETAEQRLKLAHQARRAKVAQLDDIKRAMLDTGLMAEGDPYGHADLADVIRQAITEEPQPEDTAQCWRKEPHVPHTWTLSPEEGGVDCPGVDQPAVKEQPGPDFTSPLTGIEVRDPCPHCGDRQMVPRSQFAEHVARLHPDERQSDAR